MANVTFESDILIQGSLAAHENSTAESTTDATPRDVAACWDSGENGSGVNCTQTDAAGKLIPTKAGYGKLTFDGLVEGQINQDIELRLAKNGTDLHRESHADFTATLPKSPIAIAWEGSWSANDEFTLQQNSGDGGNSCTVEYGQLILTGFASSGA